MRQAAVVAFLNVLFGSLLGAFVCGSTSARAESVTFSSPPQNHSYQPPIIGANTHFGTVRVLGYSDAGKVHDELKAIGATSFRDYMPWQSYTFPPSGPVLTKSGRLMNFLPQAQLTPLINLGLANSGVDGGVPPISDSALKIFESYIGKAVELTRPYKPIYEIWNEWNIYIGVGKPTARIDGAGSADDPRSAAHYLRVSKAAVAKIRQVDPDARVVVGAVGDDKDWAWAKAIVRGGVMDGADGLSVHLYNQCSRDPHDRTASEMIERLQTLQTDLTQIRGGAQTPIYISEFGWPTSQGNCGMPLDQSAYYFAQFVLRSSQFPWIKGIWMHELKNNSPDPVDRESNYGLFTYDDKPKPAACFMGAAAEIVKTADSIDIRQPMPDVFVARATFKDKQKIIIWTSGPWLTARYHSSTTPTAVHSMCENLGLAAAKPGFAGPEPIILDFATQDPVTIDMGS